MGFETDLRPFRKIHGDLDRILEDQDILAGQAFQLVLGLLRNRGASMSWHASWPGLLALFISDAREDQEEGLRLLRQDWEAYQAALTRAEQAPWLSKATQK
eukprot:218824-Lingulodinium_polyedra.AAC.1